MSSPSFVVGLGASAGGLEALERFFSNVSVDSGGTFVVVMHLSRDFKSVLDELLARHTTMSVLAIENAAPLHANTVYVIQPGTEVEVLGATFRVVARAAPNPAVRVSSIDTLLESIAASWGERSAAVILSGSGSDGSVGVMAIQAAGGVVFAQSPESAKFDSMPIAAIATNSVSGVDTPEMIAQIVTESVLLPRVAVAARHLSSEATALQKILSSVVGASHLDASQYTHSTFERRVQRRVKELNLKSLSAYSDLVQTDRNEARLLSETLLIGVTDFFRDEGAFISLARTVAPELIHRAHLEHRAIRIWVPGCASGEEAYSLAMVFAEAADDFPNPVDVQIFATDVHKGLLAEAARGDYPSERLRSVSDERRRKFFTRTSSGAWQFDSKLRRTIVFAPHDLLIDPPFTRLDMVSCRNLLIYFSIEAQQRVIGGFAFGLLEKGYLFLGGSETVGAQRESFEFVDVRRRIFRRTRTQSRSPLIRRGSDPYDRAAAHAVMPARRSLKQREAFLQPAYAAMLKSFAPPSFLVSGERELLHTFGDARRFLPTPEGVSRYDLTDMCDPALKTLLAAGIDRAIRENSVRAFSKIELASFPEPGLLVDVTIKPLKVEADAVYALVIIEDASSVAPPATPPHLATVEVLDHARAHELEIEIQRTREALQSTIEEIETANEQLQSTNEELMSANEELQSTNEELSSLNEELHSVNAEHFRQNNELVRITRDFDALLHATEIGVLFFDEQLNIRRFTGLIVDLFHFTEADIGRPLRTFRTPFPEFDMESFLVRVMIASVSEEAEAKDHNSMMWLLRAAPYPDQRGVVLSVISISRLRDGAPGSPHLRERIFAHAAPYIGDALIIVTPETGEMKFANRAAWVKFGIPEAPDKPVLFSRLTPELGDSSWTSWLSGINIGASASKLDVQLIDKDASIFPVDVVATIVNDGGQKHAVVRIIENRDRRRAVLELQERARTFAISNRELEQFASVVAHDLRAPLRHLNQFANILIGELGSNASPNVQEYLQIIQSSAAGMSGMVERLLEYARIGAGAPNFVDLSLRECLEQAVDILQSEITSSNAFVEYQKLSSVKGERGLIVQLFQNLITNSLKYRKRDASVHVKITTRNEGAMTAIYVDDNGIGIDSEHRDTIFKMFSRLHSDSEYSGHGMGLAICKRICDIHGGAIELDSAYTGGARFIVRIPRSKSKQIKKAV